MNKITLSFLITIFSYSINAQYIHYTNTKEVDSTNKVNALKMGIENVSVDSLINLMGHESREVRVSAIRNLGFLADSKSIIPLIDYHSSLTSGDPDAPLDMAIVQRISESRNVLVAFRDMGSKVIPDLHTLLLDSTTLSERREVIPTILSWINDTRSKTVLKTILNQKGGTEKLKKEAKDAYDGFIKSEKESAENAPEKSLINAVKAGDLQFVKKHIDNGADVNEPNENDHSPLMLAIQAGSNHEGRFISASMTKSMFPLYQTNQTIEEVSCFDTTEE